MSFDLSSLALVETFDLQLRHPVSGELLFADNDEAKPVVIQLYGSSSKQYRNAVTAMQNRALKRQAKKEKMSAEVMREEGIELNVAASAGVKNLVVGDNKLKTAEDFRKFYADAKFSWVGEQVNEALGDVANFISQ